MVLALQLYDVYQKSILGVARKKHWQVNASGWCPQFSCQREVLCAGFRHGRRACCLARPEGRNRCCGAKGPKTIDAPPGLIGAEGRQPEESGPTRGAWVLSLIEGL